MFFKKIFSGHQCLYSSDTVKGGRQKGLHVTNDPRPDPNPGHPLGEPSPVHGPQVLPTELYDGPIPEFKQFKT